MFCAFAEAVAQWGKKLQLALQALPRPRGFSGHLVHFCMLAFFRQGWICWPLGFFSRVGFAGLFLGSFEPMKPKQDALALGFQIFNCLIGVPTHGLLNCLGFPSVLHRSGMSTLLLASRDCVFFPLFFSSFSEGLWFPPPRYSKRYFGHYGPHWGYRFIQSSWLGSDKFLWTDGLF